MPQTSDDVVLVVVAVTAVALLVAGIVERRRHRAGLRRLDLRVSVNGSRGKSTVARLLTGALAAGGRRPLGKTTGTQARLVRGWTGEEVAVHRRPEGPNVGEQVGLVRRAVAEGADSLVAECMAITPDYQHTFHRQLLDADLVVITNALDDHLEQMGPTSADVADVFAASIPAAGTAAVVPGPHLERFERVAHCRDARLLVGDPDEVDEQVLARFDHLVLADHVALVLAITRHLGIPDAAAVDGMVDAPADPFATRLLPVGEPHDPALFVNAFAANDPASTLAIWEHLRTRGHPTEGLAVLMNCRDDRVVRTRQFTEEVLPELPIETLVVTGQGTRHVMRAARHGRVPHQVLHDLTGRAADDVVATIAPLRGRVVLGVGNLHGGGAELVGELEQHAVDPGLERRAR